MSHHGRPDGQMNGRTDGRTDGCADGHIYLDGRTYVRTDEKHIFEKSNHKNVSFLKCTLDGQTDGRTNGRTDGRTHIFGRSDICADG